MADAEAAEAHACCIYIGITAQAREVFLLPVNCSLPTTPCSPSCCTQGRTMSPGRMAEGALALAGAGPGAGWSAQVS